MSLFDDVEDADRDAAFAQLPERVAAMGPQLRQLLDAFDQALMRREVGQALRLFRQAHSIAVDLNGGTNFGMACEGHSCELLTASTAIPVGTVPRWGEAGTFVIEVRGCRVCIEWEGIWQFSFPSFGAHAVDFHKPFISETGYRSFLFGHISEHSTPDDFAGMNVPTAVYAARAIEAYLDAPDEHAPRKKKGIAQGKSLVMIERRYRERHEPQVAAAVTTEPVPFAEVIEEQTHAIEDARAAAAADVPFALTAPAAADDSFQLGLFTHTERTDR